MTSVRVARRTARDRSLPLVSVYSGRPADGYARAGRAPYLARVPLTQEEFDRVVHLEKRQRSAFTGGVACVLVGAALARFPVLLPLGLVIGVLSVVLYGLCHLALRRVLPKVVPGPGADEYTLQGVHPRFVEALRRAGD